MTFPDALKRILPLFSMLCSMVINTTSNATPPLFFNVSATGTPVHVNINLCLNGSGPLSCQNYTVSGLTLNIRTTIPNHIYPFAGIKINTPGYALEGCIPTRMGYCLFSTSNEAPVNLTLIKTTFTLTASSSSHGTISPNGSFTVNRGSSQLFTAAPSENFGVKEWLLDNVPVQNGGGTYLLSNITANHTVKVIFAQAALATSLSTLALSVNCLPLTADCTYTNDALTGNARQITITNNGTITATNVSLISSGLPSGTTTSSTCGNTLEPGHSCLITLTPGHFATSNCTAGTTSTPGIVTVTASNAAASQVNVFVLSYSCIYQGGYLYSLDDTTPNTTSIGGKVTAQFDQVSPNTGVIWSADSSGNYDGGVSIWGIDDSSTSSVPSPNASSADPATLYPGQSNCNGTTDGSCDTNNIYIYYNTIALSKPPLSSYAVGLCKESISGYSDWYLPSICEMGPDDGSMICSSPPLIQLEQNMVDGLPVLLDNCSGTMCLAGNYWSATQLTGNPTDIAWTECFAVNGGSTQCVESKDQPLGVRCSRALTF